MLVEILWNLGGYTIIELKGIRLGSNKFREKEKWKVGRKMIQWSKETKITEYEHFVSLVEEIGFMSFSNNPIDFINLSDITYEKHWHTGLSTDPWQWRVQIERDHKAAYGKLFDKKPGFISLEWYPKFLSARRKGLNFYDVYEEGVLSQYAKRIYELFQEHDVLAGYEIKAIGGFTRELNAKFESAMAELQMGMFITGCGTKQKINKQGQPYGWPSTAYTTVESWAGHALVEEAEDLDPEQSRQDIIQRVNEIVPEAKATKLKRFIGI